LRQKNIQASRQAPPPDLWRDYRSALDGYERVLRGLSYGDLIAVMAGKGRAAGAFRSFGLPAQLRSVFALPIWSPHLMKEIGLTQ
jgi:hypothetical protein